MAVMMQGAIVTNIDAAATFPIGTEMEDPREGQFTGNRIKYLRANGTINPNDVLTIDTTFGTANQVNGVVVSISAVAQPVEAVNDIAGSNLASPPAITSGQFFWATVKGRAQGKTSAVSAGNSLGSSGTAGTLVAITATTPTAAEVIAAIAAGEGKGCRAMTATGTPVAGQSFILLS